MNRLIYTFFTVILATSAAYGTCPTTCFNPPPDTIVNSPSIDTNSQTEVNANFAQIVTDGNAWKAAVLTALSGLSTAGMPSGGVIYWTGANCPTGYNTMNGLAGTADARGVYIRGLDTGGSVDPGRTLASYQADQFITHTHGTVGLVAGTSATSSSCFNCTIYPLSVVQSGTSPVSTSTYGMNSIGGQPETRPSSVTVLFCQKQ